MCRMRHRGSVGLLIGIVASHCGGGVTSAGKAAPLNEAGSGEPNGLVNVGADDGQASGTGGPNSASASGGQVATGDGGGGRDTSASNDVSARDAGSTGNGPSSPALDGAQPSVPQAFVSVSMGPYYDPNHNQQNTCQGFASTTELFSIGTAAGNCDPTTGICNGGGPVRVKDGDQSAGVTVNLQCSVTGGYDINLQALLGATGSLGISGHIDGTAGGQGLNGEINYEGSDYADGNCSVAFTFLGRAVPAQPPIAPGRIWAHLSCPQMTDPAGVRRKVLMDMSLVPDSCDGAVDLVFENCAQ